MMVTTRLRNLFVYTLSLVVMLFCVITQMSAVLPGLPTAFQFEPVYEEEVSHAREGHRAIQADQQQKRKPAIHVGHVRFFPPFPASVDIVVELRSFARFDPAGRPARSPPVFLN